MTKNQENPPDHVLRAIAEAKLTPVSAGAIRITKKDKQRATEWIDELLNTAKQKRLAIFAAALKELASAGPDSWVSFSASPRIA